MHQTCSDHGYSNRGYSNRGYSNHGYSNNDYSNRGYSNLLKLQPQPEGGIHKLLWVDIHNQSENKKK